MTRRRVFVNGVEYNIKEQAGVTKLERYDTESGLKIQNIFAPKPDSNFRMNAFKRKAAELVLENISRKPR